MSDITESVWQALPGSQSIALDSPADHTLYVGTRGNGKRLADNTLVLTQCGWKRADHVTYSDYLVAPDGSLTRILGIYPGYSEELYKLTFDDGAEVTCCKDHLWTVGYQKAFNRDGWKVKSTKEIMEKFNSGQRWGIPYTDIVGGKPWIGIDPYIVGYMLGNGTTGSRNVTIYTIDDSIVDYFKARNWNAYRYDYSTCYMVSTSSQHHPDEIALRELLAPGKADTKFVPQELMTADPASRLALLQGLMDSDGSCYLVGKENRSMCSFASVSKQLADDVVELARSFGCRATVHFKNVKINDRNGRGWVYIVTIGTRNKINPFRLSRKALKVRPVTRVFHTRYIDNIEEVGSGYARCFEVDHPSHMFVIQHYIVTHNSEVQLMKFRRYVGQGYGSYWRGVIFDRQYKNLDDLISKSKRLFRKFDDGAVYHAGAMNLLWRWPTGEELLFRTLKDDNDFFNYLGQEFSFIGFNELTKWPTLNLYDTVQSCNRSGYVNTVHGWIGGTYDPKLELPVGPNGEIPKPIPLITFSSTNPFGVGAIAVKRRFIDVAPYGKLVRRTTTVFNPLTEQDEEVTVTQVAIYGTWRENKYLSPKYIAELQNIEDPVKLEAWYKGSWSTQYGNAFGDIWNTNLHVIPRFKVPKDWYVDRSLDWGSSTPFSVGWWAEANGEEVDLPDGRKFCPPSGTLIRINEWYGTPELGTNKGLKLTATELAEGIVKYEDQMIKEGWVSGIIHPGPADNSIRDVRERDVDSIAKKMEDAGVHWEVSVKSPGSRINGFELARERLTASRKGEGPGLYFCDNCVASVGILPALPRDEKNPADVSGEGEDHCLHGDTLVNTSKGRVKIRELVDTAGEVYTIGGKLVKYHDCRLTRKKAKVIKLTLASKHCVICTPDHKILDENMNWIEAEQMWNRYCYMIDVEYRCEDTLEKVICIDDYGYADVYCMYVEDTHAFCIENGIIVHNCWDETRYRILKGNNRLATDIKFKVAF